MVHGTSSTWLGMGTTDRLKEASEGSQHGSRVTWKMERQENRSARNEGSGPELLVLLIHHCLIRSPLHVEGDGEYLRVIMYTKQAGFAPGPDQAG